MSFTDNFTDTNGTLLTNHTPSGGTGWTFKTGASDLADIQGNECEGDAVGQSNLTYFCDDQGSADCFTQFKATSTGNAMFPACLRMTESGGVPSYIGVRASGTKVQIFKNTAGSFTQLGSTGTTVVAVNDIIRIEASGDDIKAQINSVDEITGITETLNNTVTQQGTAPRAVARFDDFEAGVLAAAGNPWYYYAQM